MNYNNSNAIDHVIPRYLCLKFESDSMGGSDSAGFWMRFNLLNMQIS